MDPSITVFENLKQRGLISPSRILIHKRPSSRQIDFRSDRLHKKVIYAFGDLSKLPERSIAFSLLHEEGHMTRRQALGWFSLGVLISIAIITPLTVLQFLLGSSGSITELAIYLLAFAFPIHLSADLQTVGNRR